MTLELGHVVQQKADKLNMVQDLSSKPYKDGNKAAKYLVTVMESDQFLCSLDTTEQTDNFMYGSRAIAKELLPLPSCNVC